MRNIEVYGLKAVGTTMGIRFKSAKVRGGLIENIRFHDIEMDNVAFPFHFELNWHPAYSYPKIPENIPKDSIADRWIALTKPVLPPERGIPEFRNLSISDVKVTNARQAFFVNAYSEKPMYDVRWKNVSIEAAEAGSISHARDWSMENVSMSIPGSQKIELTNCVNVQLPNDGAMQGPEAAAGKEIADIKIILANLEADSQRKDILLLNDQNGIIGMGDTLFSEEISVIIFPGEENEFSFFEPMGDGFYITPVTITIDLQKKQLSASGERSHSWKFYLKSERKPATVYGVDDWEYDTVRQWLLIEKMGSKFEIQIE